MIPKKKITVLLAEDHAVVRQGLRSLLEAAGDFEVVGEASNGREAVNMASELSPEVILVDIAMPELNGVDATRLILKKNSKAKVLVLSAHSDDEYIARMTALGASGFLEKQASSAVLTRAIRTVAGGKPYFSPGIERRMIVRRQQTIDRDGFVKDGHARLTPRETEVLRLIAEGQGNKQIASILKISIKTVEKHRQQVMNKLNIHETAGLTRYAIFNRMFDGDVKVSVF